MKFEASRDKTYAVLIGVEQYGLGIRPLIGPAIDALSMCAWMVGMKVPAANISLLLNQTPSANAKVINERDRLLELVRAYGIEVVAPTQYQAEQALSVKRLKDLKAPPGSALWVYWSGHGLLTHVTRKRMVLAADSNADDYLAVDLEHTADRLRLDPTMLPFSQQLMIVDACSTWSKPTTSLDARYKDLGGMRSQGTRQNRIFAAPDGVVAEIAPDSLTSDFTGQLLACLGPSEPWSVDVGELLPSMRATGTPTANRFVVRLEDSDGNLHAQVSGQPAQRISALAAIVRGSDAFPIDTLHRLFKSVTTCLSDQCPASSQQVVMQLDDFPQDGEGLLNSERFALQLEFRCDQLLQTEDLANRAHVVALRDALVAWNAQTDQPLFLKAKNLLLGQHALPARLFIDLAETETRAWVWREAAWQLLTRLPDDGKAPLERIRLVLGAAVSGQISLKSCHLEVALDIESVALAPLGENVATRGRPMHLGQEIPLTVRIRNRWSPGEDMNNWLDNWNACRHMLEDTSELIWLDRAMPDWAQRAHPGKCVSFQHLDNPHVDSMQFHLEDGVLWALGCRPQAEVPLRAALEHCASTAALRDWIRTAGKMAQASIAHKARILLIVDTPVGLPDGIAAPLNLPA